MKNEIIWPKHQMERIIEFLDSKEKTYDEIDSHLSEWYRNDEGDVNYLLNKLLKRGKIEIKDISYSLTAEGTDYCRHLKEYDDFNNKLTLQILEEKYPTFWGDFNDTDCYNYDDNNYDGKWEEMKEDKELMAKLFFKK